MNSLALYGRLHPLTPTPTGAIVKATRADGSRSAAALTEQQRTTVVVVGLLAFGVGFLGIIFTTLGTTAAIYDQLHDTRVDMNCFRLRRRRSTPSFSIVVSMGKPSSSYELLLNLGTVHSNNLPPATIFSRNIFLSENLACNTTNKVCTDFVLVDGKKDDQGYGQLEFRFDELDSLASLGFDGVVQPTLNSNIEITTTHACFGVDAGAATAGSPLGIVNGNLVAPPSTIRELFPASPASECAEDTLIFPVESVLPSWSTVVGQSLREKLATAGQLYKREGAIERGIGSCSRNDTISMDLHLDCALLDVDCFSAPTLPYRHVSGSTLSLSLSNDTASLAVTERTVYNSAGEGGAVLLRLVVAVIISFVFFTRANFSTSATSRRAMRFLNGRPPPPSYSVWIDAIADLAVGLAALLSRAAAFLSKRDALRDGGLQVLCTTELIAILSSFLHLILRNVVLDPSVLAKGNIAGSTSPRDRLGGSMALPDASVAACIAVAALPVLITTGGDNFDDLARLLGGSLIVLFVAVRSLHSFFAAVLTSAAAATDSGFSKAYVATLVMSTLFWAAQIVAISVALSTLFIMPTSFSLTRHNLKDDTMPMLLALGALCLVGMSVRKSIVSISRY